MLAIKSIPSSFKLVMGAFVVILLILAYQYTKSTELKDQQTSTGISQTDTSETEWRQQEDNSTDHASEKIPENSIKAIRTEKGLYSFGFARIQSEGVKTTWKNESNYPIYGISYLFLEKNGSRAVRRLDPFRTHILSCKEDQKVIALPGDTFTTTDMLDNRTSNYEVKLLEVNPFTDWSKMAKNDCLGSPVSIHYKSSSN